MFINESCLFQFNMTHQIKHLSFGLTYPGIVNPLDDTKEIAEKGQRVSSFETLLKISILNSNMFDLTFSQSMFQGTIVPLANGFQNGI